MPFRNSKNVKNLRYLEILLEVFYRFEIMGDDPVLIFEEIKKEKKLTDDLIEKLKEIIIKIKNSIDVIDKMIEENILNWDKERILKVDLALLRIGIGSFLFSEGDAKKIINDILEISKIYSTEESYRFLNGILDRVAKKLGKL
ncbi:MAG: transcription antitermination factor NusB [candidate division WOR-3 bacterium]